MFILIDNTKTSSQQKGNTEGEYSTILEWINDYYSTSSK